MGLGEVKIIGSQILPQCVQINIKDDPGIKDKPAGKTEIKSRASDIKNNVGHLKNNVGHLSSKLNCPKT